MTFLEAHRIVNGFTGGPRLPFTLAMSGASDALTLFLRAAAAARQREAGVRTLAYNTLLQRLAVEVADGESEVFLLLPWDFVPECDWRSGLPVEPGDRKEICRRAAGIAALIARRRGAQLLYLPAAIPPILPDPAENAALAAALVAQAQSLGAQILSPDCFGLGAYLASGCPIAAARLGDVATAVVEAALRAPAEPRKVLVTDFDNVLWHGVIGEDGLDGIACAAQGIGYRHFLYQSLLVKLKSEGVLLVGVSRNSPVDALAPFKAKLTLLSEEDFVTVLASYHGKSAQVQAVAERLNLSLQSFVFVDDNPVELAEVGKELPDVVCLRFPGSDDSVPAFFEELRRQFAKPVITAEDRERTDLYRRRAAGMLPADGGNADVRAFLEGLEMQLTIYDRTGEARERAIQLINKTNQFNLNGRRLTEAEVDSLLRSGGRLYSAGLSDRTGNHGEILACLVTAAGMVEAFVLSCRVFERRVEHAFLAHLASRMETPRKFRYAPTERNEPARKFLEDAAFIRTDGDLLAFDAGAFAARHQDDLSLFKVTGP